jgi:Protein of unknown function (DUF4054)
MNRVLPYEVKAIISTTLTEDEVEPFIDAANVVITGKCASTYSSTELKELERWLAAHLVAIRTPDNASVKSKKAGKVEVQYFGTQGGTGLWSTPYGQQLMALDYSSTLAGLAGGRTATLRMFGASNEEFTEDTDA